MMSVQLNEDKPCIAEMHQASKSIVCRSNEPAFYEQN